MITITSTVEILDHTYIVSMLSRTFSLRAAGPSGSPPQEMDMSREKIFSVSQQTHISTCREALATHGTLKKLFFMDRLLDLEGFVRMKITLERGRRF